jgi:hypothetical protein
MLYSPTVEYHYLYEVAFVRQLILDTAVADPEGRALVEPDKPYAKVHNWRISTARFGVGCIAELPAERLPEPGPWPWISAWLDDAWRVAASEAHCGASLAPRTIEHKWRAVFCPAASHVSQRKPTSWNGN